MRFAVLILLIACGGHEEHAEHPGEHHEEHPLSPALQGFHDVLAPVWHSDPGATRLAKACDSSTAMVDKVAAVNDPELITAVSEMAKACVSDKSQVEFKLGRVHERFHQLMEK